jgi:hypothetical protein
MSPLSFTHIHHIHTSKDAVFIMIWNESTIILAIIGMVGLFSTAVIYQRSNRITSRYYSKK